jgi:membrane-bound lytic murein transglycosylase D
VERTGYADFWELRARGELPIETTNYVPIILAMTIMEKNAAAYGLDQVQMDPPLEYDTVELTALTSLPLIADVTDTSVPELAAMNPALLSTLAPAHYAVHVPKGSGPRLTAALGLIPAEHRAAWRLHRVVAGESLATIGARFGVSTASLLATNRLPNHVAVEGDLLAIPAAARPAPVLWRTPASRHGGRAGASHTASAAPAHRAPAAHAVSANPRASAAPQAKQGGPAAAAQKPTRKPAMLVAHATGK